MKFLTKGCDNIKTINKFNNKKLILILLIPVIFVMQYYFFKVGIISPMVKGIEFEIIKGEYVKEIDKFVMKLDDTITFSSGDYIKIPSYSKEPDIWIQTLDEKNVLSIDGNDITSMKEGYSTIGIMKGSNVVKKVDILVIDPYVEDLIPSIDGDLYYVGDIADIDTEVLVDYDKFETKKPVTYESSNENVIKIEDNKIVANGVGNAVLYVESGDRKEVVKEFDIVAQISQIKIQDKLNLVIGEKYKLNPQIITSPVNLKHGDIKYQFADRKLDIQRAISVDNYGNLVALREGQEEINIICQNKIKTITIDVKQPPVEEQKVENLQVSYEIIDNKIKLSLIWDYIDNINKYDIYTKNNLTQEEFELYESIDILEPELLDDKKVRVEIIKDLDESEDINLDIYVVGIKGDESTKQSSTVNINLSEDITIKTVKNLDYTINDKSIYLKWDAINIPNVNYSIYVRNNKLEDDGFVLQESNILLNEYILNSELEEFDYDIYVVANKDDKISKQSNIINIKK